jgi:hypothetical protein
VWVLVGVLVFFLLIGVAVIGAGIFVVHKAKQAGLDPDLMKKNPAVAMTRLMTAVNPNLELVKIDEGRGVVTVRDRKTGKVVSMNFDDIRNGHFKVREDGKDEVDFQASGSGDSGSLNIKSGNDTVSIGSGSGAALPPWIPRYPGSSIEGRMSREGAEETGGMFTLKTMDAAKQVTAFYSQAFKSTGLKVSGGDPDAGTITAEDAAANRKVTVTCAKDGSMTSISILYEGKR